MYTKSILMVKITKTFSPYKFENDGEKKLERETTNLTYIKVLTII